jgi:gamma-glutamyltranspeptidase/glutathione hydrolase
MPANGRVKSLFGREAAVVSGHHLATRAAEGALARGGSVMDAMVAASAVLLVALPHTSSLAGCAMALLARPGQPVVGLNGSGRAPLLATPDAFGARMPQRGSPSAVVPGLVRFWARAHERFGVLAWPSLFDAAIRIADEGCGVSEELARNLANADAALRAQPGFAQTFLPEGSALARGALWRQPRLAAVLREIAARGEDGFYLGWVAQSLLACVERTGGMWRAADFEQAQADWVAPRDAASAGRRVHVMPPNSYGTLMLDQLAASEPDLASQIAQALRVIGEGQQRIGDPARTGSVAAPGARARTEPGDTTGFVATDAHGNAVAMLQSVFQPFGSGVVDTDTGILLNNRMFDFALQPGHANEVGPGIRPAHTLNPWLVTHADGSVEVAGVSPGGVSQTTTGAQLVRALLAPEGASLGEVVSQERWSVARDGTVLLERGMPAHVANQLRGAGLQVTENSDHEFYFGSAKLVRRRDGMVEAAADPRRQAHAAAW